MIGILVTPTSGKKLWREFSSKLRKGAERTLRATSVSNDWAHSAPFSCRRRARLVSISRHNRLWHYIYWRVQKLVHFRVATKSPCTDRTVFAIRVKGYCPAVADAIMLYATRVRERGTRGKRDAGGTVWGRGSRNKQMSRPTALSLDIFTWEAFINNVRPFFILSFWEVGGGDMQI